MPGLLGRIRNLSRQRTITYDENCAQSFTWAIVLMLGFPV
jgi:hypothetical protein